MIIFRNAKDQSQRFNIFGIMYRYKNAEMLLDAYSALEKKQNIYVLQWIRKN